MKKNVILGLLMIFSHFQATCQYTQQASMQVGYYGDMVVHPGLQLGIEKPLTMWETDKKKKKYKSLNLGADLLYYWHPDNHHGIAVSPAFSYRRIKENGKFFQVKLNIGYHRSFADGKTYSVDESGSVSEVKLAGQNTLCNNLSVGFGKDLRVIKNKQIRYIWSVGINGRYPHNHSYLLGLNFGLGIHFILNKKA